MTTRTRIVAVALAALAIGAVGTVAASAAATKSACVTSDHHVYLRTACKAGETPIAAKGAKGDKGETGATGAKGEKGEPGTNSVVVKHQQILLNSDNPSNGSTIISEDCADHFAALPVTPTTHCYTVTVTGNPAYSGQLTNVQLYGDNSGGNTWDPAATVGVIEPTGIGGTRPDTGSTQRVFHVRAKDFTQTKSYNLDVWALTVVG
jgi:hypothetical protein